MSKAGPAYAFSFILAIVGCLLIAQAIAEFSRKIPTSGMAYTFATLTFGPRAGFMTGWTLLAGYVPIFSLLSAAMGFLSEQFVKTYFHWTIPWWIFTILSILAVMFICNSGVSRSARVILGFLAFEVTIFTALFITIVVKGGAHGNTLAPFSPTESITGLTGIGYGILWGYWMFFGFEAAGTLGEETENPRRNVPRALFLAVLAIGAFYILSAYAGAIGFGIHSNAFTTQTSPWDVLSRMYWGTHIGWLVLLTVINSTFAIMMSAFNATVRILYSMGREKILPSALGTTDSASQVPKRAGIYYALGTLVVVLVAGLAWGPINYWLFAGVLGAIGLIVAYIVINVSVIFYYRRNHPSEFSWWRHGLLPGLGAVIALLPLYGAVWPVPPFPMNLEPYAFIVWMVVGAAYLAYAVRYRPHVLEGMGRVFAPEADPARAS
jgi:amino acid transporter